MNRVKVTGKSSRDNVQEFIRITTEFCGVSTDFFGMGDSEAAKEFREVKSDVFGMRDSEAAKEIVEVKSDFFAMGDLASAEVGDSLQDGGIISPEAHDELQQLLQESRASFLMLATTSSHTDQLHTLNEMNQGRLYRELEKYGPLEVIRKFRDADEAYKERIRSAFKSKFYTFVECRITNTRLLKGSFGKFVEDYMESMMRQFHNGDFSTLYRKAHKKDVVSREKQVSIIVDLDHSYQSAALRLQKLSVDEMQQVESAFGFGFEKFKDLYMNSCRNL